MPRNVPAQGFRKVQCLSQERAGRGSQGTLCHQPASGFRWQNPLALPVQECCARNMKGNIQLPPMTGSERSWECQRRPPGRALKGLQLPGMGQAVAQDVPGCHQRGQEQGVGTPLTTGEQTAVSDSNHDQGGCTGAVSAHCPLPTATRTPEQNLCTTTWHSTVFWGFPWCPHSLWE